MKKIFFVLAFLTATFCCQAQTVAITPTIGVATQSLQAIETNTLSKIWLALTSPTTVTLTPTVTVYTAGSYTINAGAKGVVLLASGDFTGSLLGASVPGGNAYSFGSSSAAVYSAITFVVTTGTITAIKD